MKKQLNAIKRYLQCFLCAGFFLLAANVITAQTVTDPSMLDPGYNAAKLSAIQKGNPHVNTVPQTQVSTGENAAVTVCNSFFISRAPTFIPRNDDGSFGPVALPFTYSLFGINYNQVWINTNGTITFEGPYSGYTGPEFPIEFPVLAPFWADVDTRNIEGGLIRYGLTATSLIVTWDRVGYYNSHTDKLNTFQVILTNGTDPILPNANTSFSYGDMQWATGDASFGSQGFGGYPAVVGINRGNHSMTTPFFIAIGRFNADNADYDGPGGLDDGVHYLDNKCFLFDGRMNCTTEICNGIDDDCDNLIDEECIPNAFYRDADNDGYGNSNTFIIAATQPQGYVPVSGDCNDWDASINPGANETCNFKDDNCNSLTDEGCAVYYRDADGDSYGLWHQQIRAMVIPPGYSTTGGDCDDWDASIRPGATETCNFRDDNCNGMVDEGCAVYYRDADGDGYGLWHQQIRAMVRPPGYSNTGGDCNDANPSIHPGAMEICNGLDDNCNSQADEWCVITADAGFSNRKLPHEGTGVVAPAELSISASPNPSNHSFTISLQGDHSQGKIVVRIYDYLGRLVEMKDKLSANQIIKIGAGYSKGTYYVEAVQGSMKKTIKIIKL